MQLTWDFHRPKVSSIVIKIIVTGVTNRRKRSIPEPQVEPHTIHGGERAFLYQVDFEDDDNVDDDDDDLSLDIDIDILRI